MEVFVARQPIFDKQQNVFGYELLFRSSRENHYSHSDGDQATKIVMNNSILLIGLKKMCGEKKAFVNFTTNLLKNELATVLPPTQLVVEILESVEIDTEVIMACRKLKQMGYILAMDDFVFKAEKFPLFELADIIKVDFLQMGSEERYALIHRFDLQTTKFLAEKVETKEDYQEALKMGFSYFQGYFFSRPEIISGRDVPGFKNHYYGVLQEVSKPNPDFARIENIIKQDIALSYKLLKFINSAFFGFRTKIISIRQALVLLGIREVVKWVSLIALREMGVDKPDELVTFSLIRARFGELLAPKVGLEDRSQDLFLMGIFSLIDAFLDRPKSDVLNELPISEDIKNSLLLGEGMFQDVYELILAYEKGNWDNVSESILKLKLNKGTLPRFYQESVEWVNQVMAG